MCDIEKKLQYYIRIGFYPLNKLLYTYCITDICKINLFFAAIGHIAKHIKIRYYMYIKETKWQT